MERQIILSSKTLALVSFVLASTLSVCFLLARAHLSNPTHRHSPKPTPSTRLTIFFTFTLVISGSIALFSLLKFGHTERAEWFVYEAASIVSFFIAFLFAFANDRFTNLFRTPSLNLSFFILLTQSIFLSIYSRWTSLFFLAGLTFTYLFLRKRTAHSSTSLLISMSGIFSVIGFFILNINAFSLPQILLITALWFILSLLVLYSPKTKLPKIIEVLLLSLAWAFLIFLEFAPPTQKLIDYHHFSFYLGPAYEVHQGTSILFDFPSQYGYLSIHFISFALNILGRGFTFASFHFFHTIMLCLYFFGFFLAYKFLFKNQFLIFLFTAITILLQTYLQQFGGLNLPPSTASLRFMFGLLIILSLWYIPSRQLKIFFASLFTAIATFWAIETALYTIPALFFFLITESFLESGISKQLLFSFFKKSKYYFFFSFLIWLGIAVREFPYHHTFPNFSGFLQFANTYKDGFGAILIPPFGNHYLAITILLLGLFYSFYFLRQLTLKNDIFPHTKPQKTKWIVLGLCFLSVHNFAILSYYVSRSAFTNILNIGPFFVLEFAILYRYFQNRKIFINHFLLPSTLFIVLFFYSCYANVFYKTLPPYNPPCLLDTLNSYQHLASSYKLSSSNTLILSKNCDTLLITENNLHNLLPLNPSLMTAIPMNFENQYILPNLKNLTDSSYLVYTNDMPAIFQIIGKYFNLEEERQKDGQDHPLIGPSELSLYRISPKSTRLP